MTFRFEICQNFVTKHHLGRSDTISWEQASNWAMMNNSGKTTICSVNQIDADTVEIVKRHDVKLGFCYKFLSQDAYGLYERVTINRAAKTVSIDRLDANWWISEPFMGRRDLFYLEKRGDKPEMMTFVRHDSWRYSMLKFPAKISSHYAAWSYARAFKNAPRQ